MTSNVRGKTLFIGILGGVGCIIGFLQGHSGQGGILGALWGGGLGCGILFLEFMLRKISSRALLGGILGGSLGLAFGTIVTRSFFLHPAQGQPLLFYLQRSIEGIGLLLGVLLGLHRSKHLHLRQLLQIYSEHPPSQNYKILDTSVIIDGRIADISETGFLEGVLIIPQFILKELQHIADSPDPIKRNRGRRGLEILHKVQKRVDIQVEIYEKDFPAVKEIDAKLVEMGKFLHAKLITNDFNLNKVAELQGVSVLNVNELANALKPVVLPGEIIEVQVLKEGKEYGQGIAYLDDGTMIVIDHAKKLIGKMVNVSVTSVLQTTAGRMIFGQLDAKNSTK